MKSKIVLIRHGITTANLKRLYYGRTDVPLSEKGIREIKANVRKDIYPKNDKAEYYTSGLYRTEQTLELIYGQVEHGQIEKLRELDFGDFEMKSYQELKDVPEYQKWIEGGAVDPTPNGEGVKGFKERVIEGFEQLKGFHGALTIKLRNQDEEAMTICVCHGGVISAIMNYIWPNQYEDFYGWIPDPGHGYILNLEDAGIISSDML